MQLGGHMGRRGRGARARGLGLIALAWALSMTGHYLVLGVRLGGDSGRYLEGARSLLAGQALMGKQLQFLGYEGLVALSLGIGAGQIGVVAAQALLALATAWLLWRAGSLAFGPVAGWLAALAYLAYPDVQAWNFYLLTDGPFTSLLTACLCLAMLAGRQARWWLGLAPALVWLALLRPEGALFLLPLAAYFALRRGWGRALLLGGAAAALFVLAGGAGAPAREDVLGHWQRGTVVWGAAMDWPSGRLAGSGGDAGGLAAWLGQAVLGDPLWVAGLLARRWFWFLAHLRPYYSLAHNAVAGLVSLLLLGLAGRAAWLQGAGGDRHDKALPLLALLLQAALVGMTWADYDGRCLVRVTPALMLLAAAGLDSARPRGEYLN